VRDGVVYQVYPRSFSDSDGDGVGDLRGIRERLGYVEWLGVDAVWLSPIYRSPMADYGYDVSDYEQVDPVFGTLEDFAGLAAEARQRDLGLLLDFVPCHTSVEHRWFEEHPDWYIWADGRDGGPPNNWVAAFGGSAWTYHPGRGRWYLHSFYPEQPDLDWRNPEVVRAMQQVLELWTARGADGFRVDAIDRLMKDPELRDEPPRTEPFPFPLNPQEEKLALVNSRNGPGTGAALAKMRAAVGDGFLVGEIYLPSAQVGPYLDHLDRFFVFELLFAHWHPRALRQAIEGALAAARREGTAPAWVLSNHDFGWLASRLGRENAETALTLLLSLPGTVFLYQGDEIGMENGLDSGGDRYGRDGFRVPVPWDEVERQRADAGSLLHRTRAMIAQRRALDGPLEFLDDPREDVLAYRRGDREFRLVVSKAA
jgi:alpha-glucosidase